MSAVKRTLLAAAFLLCLSGCAGNAPIGETPSPTATPKDPALKSAADEEDTQDIPAPEDRLKVRRAASDFAAAQSPRWRVEGVGVFTHSGNLYLAAVELSKGTERKTVNLVARMFVAPDNTTYWRVELMTPELMQFVAGVTEQEHDVCNK